MRAGAAAAARRSVAPPPPPLAPRTRTALPPLPSQRQCAAAEAAGAVACAARAAGAACAATFYAIAADSRTTVAGARGKRCAVRSVGVQRRQSGGRAAAVNLCRRRPRANFAQSIASGPRARARHSAPGAAPSASALGPPCPSCLRRAFIALMRAPDAARRVASRLLATRRAGPRRSARARGNTIHLPTRSIVGKFKGGPNNGMISVELDVRPPPRAPRDVAAAS
jgi:hypothetical protein